MDDYDLQNFRLFWLSVIERAVLDLRPLSGRVNLHYSYSARRFLRGKYCEAICGLAGIDIDLIRSNLRKLGLLDPPQQRERDRTPVISESDWEGIEGAVDAALHLPTRITSESVGKLQISPLRAERQRRGLTAERAAALCEVSTSTFLRVERGWQCPPKTLARIRAVFGDLDNPS